MSTSSKAKNKYNNKAYDRLAINVKKGERERIAEYAAKNGERRTPSPTNTLTKNS